MLYPGDPESWSGAVDVLVGNAINLMKYISDLLKDTEIASIGHGEQLSRLHNNSGRVYNYLQGKIYSTKPVLFLQYMTCFLL